MTRQELGTVAVLLGMSVDQTVEALETPVAGECFWLGGHCGMPCPPGDWLCDEHRGWTPDVATRDAVDAREFAWESVPHLKAVA